jgi:phosphatidylglycerol lysyltransferase
MKVKHLLGPITGFFLFAASLWALHHLLEDYRYEDIAAEFGSLTPAQIAAAVALTAASYLSMSLYDVLAVRYLENPLPFGKVGFASAVSYAFSNTVGVSILTSSSVRYRLYASWGLSPLEIGKIIAFCAITFWLGLLTTGGGVLLAKGSMIPQFLPLQNARWFGAALAALPVVYLGICRFGPRKFQWGEQEVKLPSGRLALIQIAIGALDWALSGSVLFVLLPDTVEIGLTSFLGIYLLAQMASLISHVPGGLGVFESLILLMMPPTVSSAILLGAILAYRLIYYLLPLTLAAGALGTYEYLQRHRRLAGVLGQIGPWASGLAPQIFSVWALVSGSLMLFSGATPALLDRMNWLSEFLPLPLVEISHFLGSLVGTGLLLLARGLQRRLDGAWLATNLLLTGGILFSLLKGGDYEEALILTILLLALLPTRRQFYRRSSIFHERFSPGWTVSIALLLACSTWLGFFSFKHVDYAHELWWQFSFGEEGDAPRFMRAQVGALVLSVGFALARLLRPAAFRTPAAAPKDLAQAEKIIRQYPETYPNLVFLEDKNLLFSDEQDGFLMYGVEGRSWIAMGDPIGSTEAQRELAWKFRELTEFHDGWTVFYQVKPENLPLYVDLGLSLLKIGEEAVVDLPAFSLEGKSSKSLRNIRHKLEKLDYRFEILSVEDVPQRLGDLKSVSDAWLSTRTAQEKRFSLGYFYAPYLLRNPVAVVVQGHRIVAFANIWRSAGCQEASVDLMRFLPGIDNGLMDFLFVKLLLWAKSEGYRYFNLGMAPLSGLPDHALTSTWNRFGSTVFGRGERFYNFRGVRQYKDKFNPRWEPRYLAVPRERQIPAILLNLASLIGRGVRGIALK